MKVFWLFNHPAPYKVDYFNELGKEVDLDVYFERGSEKSRSKMFYSEQAKSFRCNVCSSLQWGEGDNYTHKPIEALKRNSYDIVVINGWRTLTEQRAISYCRRHGIPYVFWINGGIIKEKESRLFRRIKTHFISKADTYFAPDQNSASYLIHYGAEKNKIVLYPYSTIFIRELVKCPPTSEEKKTLHEKLNLQGKRIFLSVGQFIERKNYKELIRLWRLMDSDDHLYLLGEGEQKEEYQKLIDSLGIKNVTLLPFKPHDEVLEYFRAGDCFVFLSKEDIYGHVVNEALSQALPVVSSNKVNAALHLIKNGENGFLVDLGDENKIIEVLQSFPSEKMSQKALETARENTMEESAHFFVDFFRRGGLSK